MRFIQIFKKLIYDFLFLLFISFLIKKKFFLLFYVYNITIKWINI